jgi:hypothetical protein
VRELEEAPMIPAILELLRQPVTFGRPVRS